MVAAGRIPDPHGFPGTGGVLIGVTICDPRGPIVDHYVVAWTLSIIYMLCTIELTGRDDMDSGSARLATIDWLGLPGAAFGEVKLPGRKLDPGMGLAVGRRTVFRPDDQECFGRVADRVAAGNMALLGRTDPLAQVEQARLRNAIASGALLTSGRHLQHGDADQPTRNMEVFTNCATAAASFAKFYLLLNGSGVGRSYDDALMAVDWANAPTVLLHLSADHPDHPARNLKHFAADLGLPADAAAVRDFLAREMLACLDDAPADAITYRIDDSREGWAKAVEYLEAMTFRGERDRTLVLDFSAIRPSGAPILGMQGRPASGPVSLLRAFLNIRRHVIAPARTRDLHAEAMQRWEQA